MTSTYLSDDSFDVNEESHVSDESDSELPDLPSMAISPNKAHSSQVPQEIQHTPTKQLISSTQTSLNQLHLTPDGKRSISSSPIADLSTFSPLRPTHHHQRITRLDRGHALAKRTEELAKDIKARIERNDKLESYKASGGILAVSKKWEEEEQERKEESNNDTASGSSPVASHPPSLETPLPVMPPGIKVFLHQASYIQELYPPGWVEEDKENRLEKHLLTQDSPDTLREIICNDMIKLCYQSKVCPKFIWQWLFQIMCHSCDPRLANSAWRNLDALMRLAVSLNENSSIYSPTVSDVIDALVEMGADKTKLVETAIESEAMQVDVAIEVTPPLQNLSLLLRYLSTCNSLNNLYTVGDAVSLILLLVKTALDPHLVGECITRDLVQLVAVLIQSIPEEHWEEVSNVLVSKIAAISPHHHDMLYLTQFLTGSWVRVRQLQKMLAKKFIEFLTLVNSEQCSEEQQKEEEEELGDQKDPKKEYKDCFFVLKVVGHFRSLETHTIDYYKMYSIMSMLALFMHPMEMTWPSEKLKKQVATQLGVLSSIKIRDHPSFPERGPVKDLIIRMKMELGVQKVGSQKQQDLFSFGR